MLYVWDKRHQKWIMNHALGQLSIINNFLSSIGKLAQISSVMKGIKGWSSLRIFIKIKERVCLVSSVSLVFEYSRYLSANSYHTNSYIACNACPNWKVSIYSSVSLMVFPSFSKIFLSCV